MAEKGSFRWTAGHVAVMAFVLLLPADGMPAVTIFIGSFRVGVADIALAVMTLLAGLQFAFGASVEVRLFRWVAGLFAFAVLTSFVSGALFSSQFGAKQLKSSLNFVEFFSIFFSMTVLVRSTAFAKRLLRTFAVISLSIAFLTTVKALGVHLPGYDRSEITGFGALNLGQVALFGRVMGLSLVILGAFPGILTGGIGKRLQWPMGAILVVAALSAFSRNLWLALVVQAGVFLVLSGRLPTKGLTRMILGSGYVVGMVILLINLSAVKAALIAIRPVTVEGREAAYTLAGELLRQHPQVLLFGIGRSGDLSTLSSTGGVLLAANVIHNFILDVLIAYGLPFTAAVLLLLWILLYRLWKVWRSSSGEDTEIAAWLITGIMGMLSLGMFAPITMSLIYWGYLGIAYAFLVNHRLGALREGSRRGAAAEGDRLPGAVGEAPA